MRSRSRCGNGANIGMPESSSSWRTGTTAAASTRRRPAKEARPATVIVHPSRAKEIGSPIRDSSGGAIAAPTA